ncbi:MAG: TrbG/VirB9 family P-type conjugative transfer protein [Vitreimonas sp.]
MKLTASLAALAALLHAGAASADDRIRQIDFNPERVVRIDACLGFQTMIEFGPDERIENVGVGDATQWLVVPNARADLLFVRPALAETHSNMTVATSRRRYVFELSAAPTPACQRGETPYYLRFRYTDVAAQPAAQPAGLTAASFAPATAPVQSRNAAYTFSGPAENVPTRVFDDGRSTYFKWAEGAATPAVFAVTSDGSETPASFVSRGEYLVVDQVAARFVLRKGESVTTLFNDGYAPTPTLDAASPQPRSRNRRGRS